jgi:hypothetical protein
MSEILVCGLVKERIILFCFILFLLLEQQDIGALIVETLGLFPLILPIFIVVLSLEHHGPASSLHEVISIIYILQVLSYLVNASEMVLVGQIHVRVLVAHVADGALGVPEAFHHGALHNH